MDISWNILTYYNRIPIFKVDYNTLFTIDIYYYVSTKSTTVRFRIYNFLILTDYVFDMCE